jgi:hypothetical protein
MLEGNVRQIPYCLAANYNIFGNVENVKKNKFFD